MASYLITGSSRGLGLALATLLSTFPSSEVGIVFATARSLSPSLKTLTEASAGRVVFVQLDTSSEESIKKAVLEVDGALSGKGLDVLVNNAGISNPTFDGLEKMDNLMEHLNANVNSVHLVTRAFLPLLRRGTTKKIVNISSSLGSIEKARSFFLSPCPAYKISKTTLNALTVMYSLSLEDEGFTVFAVSPGWLKTGLGGGDIADLTVEQGAKACLDKITSAGKEQSGKLLNIHVKGWEKAEGPNQYDGEVLPW